MRIAPGHYESSNDIRNAPGLRTFNQALLDANRDADGTLTIDLLAEGEYSVWARLNSGKTYIFYPEVLPDVITPTYEGAKGLNITIDNISSDVKDIFIAPGTLTTYRQCSDNKIVRLYDFGDKTYNRGRTLDYLIDYRKISESGDYTMCVRYLSGREHTFTYFHIDVPAPQLQINGLQVTINDLRGIKSIRTAPGSYETASEVKAAPGMRAFVKNGALKDVGEENNYTYTVQYRDSGTYTISIEYQGGYIEIRQVNLTKKEATVTRNSNKTLTFGNLDGLYIIRYAPGTLTAQSQFKRTVGNKYLKPNAIVNGTITTEVLSGTWSFMVQFNDESYTIFTVDFSDGNFVEIM